MEKGRLTDCIDMRYHTKGLIKDDSNIACTGGAGYSPPHYIYQQKIVVAEVDRKRILRERRTCLYLISACWKASMRPCPAHSLPIWPYSDSYQKQTTSWTWSKENFRSYSCYWYFNVEEQRPRRGRVGRGEGWTFFNSRLQWKTWLKHVASMNWHSHYGNPHTCDMRCSLHVNKKWTLSVTAKRCTGVWYVLVFKNLLISIKRWFFHVLLIVSSGKFKILHTECNSDNLICSMV